jgi:hypothetical protein
MPYCATKGWAVGVTDVTKGVKLDVAQPVQTASRIPITEQAGLRFLETSPQAMQQLREWLQQNSSEVEPEDPPIRCQLTDLSLSGCYLEIASPFPLSTRIVLSMRAAGVEVRASCVGCTRTKEWAWNLN